MNVRSTELADFDWGSLHDAVLVSARIDWEFGTAEVVLNLPAPPYRRVAIRAWGLEGLSCPREQPWGRSVHVNDAKVGASGKGASRSIRIEMQSGDTVELKAERIGVEILELQPASHLVGGT